MPPRPGPPAPGLPARASPPRASPPRASPPRAALLLLAYLAFASLGLPDGLLGVGWPSIRADLGVPIEAVGLLLTAGSTGYLTSSVLAGFTLARLGVGALLAGSTLLTSLALTGYATSPAMAVTTGCALLLGLGSGAIDSGLNAYAAGAFGARHMNWMHAFFGLGVAAGPLILTGVLNAGLDWRWGYGVVAAAQLALAAAFARTVRAWRNGPLRRPAAARTEWATAEGAVPAAARPARHRHPRWRRDARHRGRRPLPRHRWAAGHRAPAGPYGDPPAPAATPARARDTLRLPTVWLGAVAFVVYVAIEIGTGLWAFLLLTEGRGLTAGAAGVALSGYWASLFVGRVVQGIGAERLGPGRVLRGSLLGMAAGAALVALPAPAWVAVSGLLVLGFAAAPVYPLLTLNTAERVGAAHADRTIGVQTAAAGLGGSVVPTGIGVLLGRTSVEALGPALLVLAVALVALHRVASRPLA
ncbi:MFS transporter [Micromonospora olivasterospora]|uniref:MFS transporter n=1 Tax=Micromonospora olivasterospora TaxID=1880 RepID=A0A562IEX2_MICOL|nr:MFS transporter [Micromonospora olivasterospora]TWH69376.1 MFS transporter [Micromonospora olivasterospora]